MARDVRVFSKRARLAYGLGCIALGCYPLLLSVGLLPIDQSTTIAPMWVVALAGLVFVVAGFMLLLARHSRANDLLAGVLLVVFGIIGAWVAVFSPSEGHSGGVPFLPRELNVAAGRYVFGFGAIICFALAAYAFRSAITNSRRRDTKATH